jgi:hypothetical protein
MTPYDRGFNDGLKYVADLLRKSAAIVEAPVRAPFKCNGGQIEAIARSGNPKLAADYREIAKLLEDAANDGKT